MYYSVGASQIALKIGVPSSKAKYSLVIDSEQYREGKMKKGLDKTVKYTMKPICIQKGMAYTIMFYRTFCIMSQRVNIIGMLKFLMKCRQSESEYEQCVFFISCIRPESRRSIHEQVESLLYEEWRTEHVDVAISCDDL